VPAIAASTGSACHAGQTSVSPVLTAMGLAPDIGRGAIRFSVGRSTSEQEIDEVVAQLTQALATL
jgi:cysteine desulfurase